MHDSWYIDDQEEESDSGAPAQFNPRQFNQHSILPWKAHDMAYELWNGMMEVERTIMTAWIHGQLKGELPIITQTAGAKDGCLRLCIRKEDAEFIVEAVNSYYAMREENEALKNARKEDAA